jgi:hypothetical protein
VNSSRSNIAMFVPLLIIAVIGIWLGFWSRHRGDESPGRPPQQAGPGKLESRPLPNPSVDRSPEALLGRVFSRLRAGPLEPLKPGELDAFRKSLLEADPAEAIAAIKRFLATGQDALTGETFAIGEKGELAGAPTFRVLLLDLLGRICRENHLTDAGDVSRALMEKKTSADEWAIALRNTAWTTPGDRTYLTGKTRELLAHQPWRQQPSAGYFEAFDVIVYTRDVSFVVELSDFIHGEDAPLKNTAASTLDRLAAMAPLDVMNHLNTNPAELADRPFLRSDYFAKADFTQPAQRAAVETYLDRTDVDPRAKAKLIAALAFEPPVFVSDNLLTPQPVADVPVAQTAAVRQTVDNWIKNNRFPSLTAQLLNTQARLKP